MLSPRKKKTIPIPNENENIPILSLEDEIPSNLLKDFKVPVCQNDFLKLKDDSNKTLGFFDEVMSLLYKNTKSIYYVKAVEKKKIINEAYKDILNKIYKLNNNNCNNKNMNIFDYILNLETHWEDSERIFLVFEGIKRYCQFENLLKNYSQHITEEHIIKIFRQILEIVNFLQDNNFYGCNLYIDSFIYDKQSQTIKLTDIGFSKIFKSYKNLNDNQLENGSEFNEYVPPEFMAKISDPSNYYAQDKLKNSYYDIWQLGILFYKIATFGESPYDDAKNENLKECIMNKNINYSRLNKYSPQIAQIIDKMLQSGPNNRYTVKQLLALEPFKKDTKIPLLNINTKNEDKTITLNMVNKEKGKDFKIDMASLLDNMEAKRNLLKSKSSIINEEKEKDKDQSNAINKNSKDILKKVRIQGNLVNDKITMISQEIYPEGSVIPLFKNKFLSKFNNIDKNLVIDLSNKLGLLEKEYKKLVENKLAVYNITNYVNNNIKEINTIDNDNIELLIKKFNSLDLSKVETNDLYEEMVKNKADFPEDKVKALISNLIYEIKRLDIELDQEKINVEKLKKKMKDLEKRNMELESEYQEKVEFYEKKIDLLEEVIFNIDNKNLNTPEKLKNNNQLIYNALTNSIENFTAINIKLKESLEENIMKFKDNKKFWLQDIIKAKENFRNEMQFYLQKANEKPKSYIFEKKDKIGISNKNEKDEKMEELKKKITELYNFINEQKILIDNNTNLIKDLKKEIKTKEEENEELIRLLKNKE